MLTQPHFSLAPAKVQHSGFPLTVSLSVLVVLSLGTELDVYLLVRFVDISLKSFSWQQWLQVAIHKIFADVKEVEIVFRGHTSVLTTDVLVRVQASQKGCIF